MLKYADTAVVFAEIPDEISLCINISKCPCGCIGCHTSYLAKDIGEELSPMAINKLIKSNPGITCVAFMGGDIEPDTIDMLASFIKTVHPDLKTAWYSGRDFLSNSVRLMNFDYIKIGHYDKERGALTSPTTNQIFYRIIKENNCEYQLKEETYRFCKKLNIAL